MNPIRPIPSKDDQQDHPQGPFVRLTRAPPRSLTPTYSPPPPTFNIKFISIISPLHGQFPPCPDPTLHSARPPHYEPSHPVSHSHSSTRRPSGYFYLSFLNTVSTSDHCPLPPRILKHICHPCNPNHSNTLSSSPKNALNCHLTLPLALTSPPPPPLRITTTFSPRRSHSAATETPISAFSTCTRPPKT